MWLIIKLSSFKHFKSNFLLPKNFQVYFEAFFAVRRVNSENVWQVSQKQHLNHVMLKKSKYKATKAWKKSFKYFSRLNSFINFALIHFTEGNKNTTSNHFASITTKSIFHATTFTLNSDKAQQQLWTGEKNMLPQCPICSVASLAVRNNIQVEKWLWEIESMNNGGKSEREVGSERGGGGEEKKVVLYIKFNGN